MQFNLGGKFLHFQFLGLQVQNSRPNKIGKKVGNSSNFPSTITEVKVQRGTSSLHSFSFRASKFTAEPLNKKIRNYRGTRTPTGGGQSPHTS